MKPPGNATPDRDRLCGLMEEVPFFSGYTWPELQTLAGYFEASSHVEVGTVLFREGDPGNFLCVVVRGAVDVVKEDHQGLLHVVTSVNAGKTLGEMALVDDEPRSATARVTQAAELLMLSKERFALLGEKHPGLALRFVFTIARLISKRLRLTSGMLVDYLD